MPLLFALSCKESVEKPPTADFAFESGIEGPKAIHLFDELAGVKLGGLAKTLVESPPQSEHKSILSIDFEDGTFGSLMPFAGVGVDAAGVTSHTKIVPCPGEHAGSQCLKLDGEVTHGMSLRTAPIKVNSAETYTLSYDFRGKSVSSGQKVIYGGASVILYKIKEGADAAAVLKNPAQEKRARLPKPPASLWVPSHYGTSPWTHDSDVFTVPAQATHMVVSFDLSRSKDDREAHKPRGHAYFNDISLTRSFEPLQLRYKVPGQGGGESHPLKLSLVKRFADARKDVESRYAIYAPAPSTLTWTVKVPEQALLSFGMSLLPEALSNDGPDVDFLVKVNDGTGEKTLFNKSLDAGDSTFWRDGEVDLKAYAGKEITLTLETVGPTDGATPFSLPDAAAVFSYPVLHSTKHPGKLVVLMVFDTLTSKRSSTYGYDVETMPELTRIAKEGVRFERALTPSAWTLASFSGILTGLDPAHHRAGERQYGTQAWRRPLASGFVTLAERFRLAGYATHAWINNPYLTSEFGLHEGFSHFVDVNTRSRMEASAPGQEAILRALRRPVGYDRFFFIHYMDPHGPYHPNPDFKEKFFTDKTYDGRFSKKIDGWDFLDLTQGKLQPTEGDKTRLTHLYESVIAYADSLAGAVFDKSKEVTAADRFALFITADHGEEMWEHEHYEHGHAMYGELLEVPLVAVVPGRQKAGRVVSGAVSAHDVAPSILEWAGIPVEEGELDAKSLFPYIEGENEASAERVLYGHQMLYGVQRLGIEQGGFKLIYNENNTGPSEKRSPKPKERYELYDIKSDPGEQKNLASSRPDDVRRLMDPLAKGFIRSLAGHYVIWLDSGSADGAPHTLEGTLSTTDDSIWLRYTEDLLWPNKKGQGGPIHFRVGQSEGKSAMKFKISGPRALASFQYAKGDAPVKLYLKLDGKPLPPQLVQFGDGTLKPETTDVVLNKEELILSGEGVLTGAIPEGSPRVVFAYIPETPELVGVGESVISDETAEALKALGYTQ